MKTRPDVCGQGQKEEDFIFTTVKMTALMGKIRNIIFPVIWSAVLKKIKLEICG